MTNYEPDTSTKASPDLKSRFNKALLLANFHRAISTQNIDQLWPLYTFLYENDLLNILTKHNYYQLFTFTTRSRATSVNYYRIQALVEDMRKQGVPLRLTEYNTLMHWIGGRSVHDYKTHHLKEALNLLAEMQRSNVYNDAGQCIQKQAVQPSAETFNTLISIASKLSDILTVQKLYHEMISRKLIPDMYTYSILITTFGKAHDIRGVEEILNETRKNLGNPDLRSVVLWNSILSAYSINGKYNKVYMLLEKMKRPAKKCSKAGVRKLTRKHKRGIPAPDSETYRIIIDMKIQKKDSLDEIIDIFNEMKNRSLIPFVQIYNSLFRLFMDPQKQHHIKRTIDPRDFKKHSKLNQIYLSYKRHILKISPNTETLYTLVSAFLDLGDVSSAMEGFVLLNNYKKGMDAITPQKNIYYNAVGLLARERHTIETNNATISEIPMELVNRLKSVIKTSM